MCSSTSGPVSTGMGDLCGFESHSHALLSLGWVSPGAATDGVTQGRIIHCAGCTMGGGPRRKGAPADQLPNFYHAVLTFERSLYA